jgi:hypothetical protein
VFGARHVVARESSASAKKQVTRQSTSVPDRLERAIVAGLGQWGGRDKLWPRQFGRYVPQSGDAYELHQTEKSLAPPTRITATPRLGETFLASSTASARKRLSCVKMRCRTDGLTRPALGRPLIA